MTNKISGIFLIRGDQGLTRLVKCSDLTKRIWEWDAASEFPPIAVASITCPYTRHTVAEWLQATLQDRSGTNYPEGAIYGGLKRVFAPHHFRG